jgi:hypothetical protein
MEQILSIIGERHTHLRPEGRDAPRQQVDPW